MRSRTSGGDSDDDQGDNISSSGRNTRWSDSEEEDGSDDPRIDTYQRGGAINARPGGGVRSRPPDSAGDVSMGYELAAAPVHPLPPS